MYQTYTANQGQSFIIRLADNVYIPIDEHNADYQAFLEWVEEGNEIEVPQ
jgi:hypothetical protein